jgi:hypothetical protein
MSTIPNPQNIAMDNKQSRIVVSACRSDLANV